MEDTADPAHPAHRVSAAARLVARGVNGELPAWLRPTAGESRWGATACLAGVVAIQLAMPDRFSLHPQWAMPAGEVVLLGSLLMMDPGRLTKRSPKLRALSLFLLLVTAASEAISLGLLVHSIVNGKGIKAIALLTGGGEIWALNVLVFALIYWDYDRGGPAERAQATQPDPDLLFSQMTDEHLARDWEPKFLDYLFVSFTCSSAYSPTDTMPLSRWCKVLFMMQSMLSLITVTLVAARAVNILPGS